VASSKLRNEINILGMGCWAMKIKWYPLILIGLVVLLTSSCVLTEGCYRKTQTEEPKFGPLESPFSEIIPSAEDLSLSIHFSLSLC